MSDQHQIIPPSVFVWDLSRPNIGRLIIHTMEAANDLYTRGDVYDYGIPLAVLTPINVEGLGFRARTRVNVPVFSEPSISRPYLLTNSMEKIVSNRDVDILEIVPDWFRVFPPVTIRERPMWIRIKDCVRFG